MCQLMFAEDLKRRCHHPGDIEGYDIPELNLSSSVSDVPTQGIVVGSQLTRIALCCAMIDRFKPSLVDLDYVIFRYGNFGKPKDYFHLFPETAPATEIPDDYLLIHVRLGDVSRPTHPLYGPLPIRYYEYLTTRTGLKPIFVGEFDSSNYTKALKSVFPTAVMLTSPSAISDFQIIRGAKHVALSVSSFSWMASFLSTKAEQ